MLLLGMEEFWVYSKLNYVDDWIVPESSTDQVRTVAAGGRNLLPGSLRESKLWSDEHLYVEPRKDDTVQIQSLHDQG